MNLYHAYYKRQYYDEKSECWLDTFYTCQGIVVIADCYETARTKIEECLAKVEHDKFRAVMASDIVECLGLDARQGFEGSFDLNPIVNA